MTSAGLNQFKQGSLKVFNAFNFDVLGVIILNFSGSIYVPSWINVKV